MIRTVLAAVAFAGVLALPVSAQTQPPLTGDTAIHDPSVIYQDGVFASFATGVESAPDGGMPRTKTSPDGLDWTEAGAIPGGQPVWIERLLGHSPRNLWAPSISVHGGLAYLYYAASSFGTNRSLIGLMVNPAFDPTRPAEGWEDRAMVIDSHPGDPYNAIDPFRIDLFDGTAWLAFGSFWNGIYLVALDPASGLRLGDDPPVPIASRGGGPIEAPSILSWNGRFYLFVSFDFCCRGPASTYRIMVGRADSVGGPYLDRDGVPMLEGGGTELLAAQGTRRGPGGQEAFMVGDESWLAWHYYDAAAGGVPRLQIARIHWDEDGWPFLAPAPTD